MFIDVLGFVDELLDNDVWSLITISRVANKFSFIEQKH